MLIPLLCTLLVPLALVVSQPATEPPEDEADREALREQEERRWQLPERVEGTVTDALTGEPIRHFRVIPGLYVKHEHGEFRRFEFGSAAEFEDGEYIWINEGRQPDVIVRIEADGYEPAVSGGLSDHVVARFDAKLKRAENIKGVVATPEGKPAKEALLLFATKDAPVTLNNEEAHPRGPDESLGLHAFAGDDGHFELTPLSEDWRVVVVHESGTAEMRRAEFAKAQRITLHPWGRIEGILKIGSKPGAGETILHYSVPAAAPDQLQISRLSTATCDQAGRFVFERVSPGTGHIARQLQMNGPGDRRLTTISRVNVIDVKPGEIRRVDLGGVGRPVVGRATRAGGIPANWFASGNTVMEKQPPPDRPARQYPFAVAADGTFRVEDVEPGAYRLSIWLSEVEATPDRQPRIGGPIAYVQHEFTVPDIPGGQTDEPLDLGELEVKSRE